MLTKLAGRTLVVAAMASVAVAQDAPGPSSKQV